MYNPKASKPETERDRQRERERERASEREREREREREKAGEDCGVELVLDDQLLTKPLCSINLCAT